MVTSTDADPSARAHARPPKPPPTITTLGTDAFFAPIFTVCRRLNAAVICLSQAVCRKPGRPHAAGNQPRPGHTGSERILRGHRRCCFASQPKYICPQVQRIRVRACLVVPSNAAQTLAGRPSSPPHHCILIELPEPVCPSVVRARRFSSGGPHHDDTARTRTGIG